MTCNVHPVPTSDQSRCVSSILNGLLQFGWYRRFDRNPGKGVGATVGFLPLTFFMLFSIGSCASPDNKLTDQAKLQGNWKVVQLVDNGRVLPKETTARWSVTFAGNKMTVIEPEASHEITFQLDPAAKPKRMNVTPSDGPQKDKQLSGIYEIEGNTIRICLPNHESKKRPSRFVSEKGSDLGLMVLRHAD